jgi:hypothetical protein
MRGMPAVNAYVVSHSLSNSHYSADWRVWAISAIIVFGAVGIGLLVAWLTD